MTRLPQEEIAFYYAEMMQLPPDRRQIFVDNVVQTLDAIAPRCAAFAARGPRRWTLQRAVPRWTRKRELRPRLENGAAKRN